MQKKTTHVFRDFKCISKTFYTPAGKDFNVVNGNAVGYTIEAEPFTPNTYQNMLGRIDTYVFIPRIGDASSTNRTIKPYRSSREFTNKDGSLSFRDTNAPDTVIPYTLEVNGKTIGKNLSNETNIQYNMQTNQTFVHIVMYGRKADEIIHGSFSFGYGAGHSATAFLEGYFVFFPECGAQFHFVDDLQYRKATNIKGNGELPQRSSEESGKFSTKPFKKLDLTDLHDSKNVSNVNVSNVMFANNAISNYFAPLLSFDGDKKKDSVKRPTMDDLKNTNIPGYLYYSNDIDTPIGGKFTKDNIKNFGNYDYGIVRDSDDNQVTTKHYYVTFRPIPTQLVVQYKDLQNNIESGKKYAIYAGNTLVSDTLTSSSNTPTAPTKDELQTMITDKNTALLSEAAGYASGNNIYLAPGSYTVKPTAEAPENYEWVVDSTDIVDAPTDANVNIAVHKDDNVSTQQVVTFVLRKKIATVTFFDGDDSKPYATVAVQKGSSIDGDELKNQSMPKDPTKPGFTFNGWFTGKDGQGTRFTGDTPVSSNISVHSSYTSNPPAPAPTPEPEPNPTSEPELDIDWDDIPDIDLTPDKEPEPVPFIVAPAPILPPAEAEPEPAPAPATSQPEQPEQQPKHAAKHLPKTGSTATPVLASAIASLFAGLAGLAKSFAATRKRRN